MKKGGTRYSPVFKFQVVSEALKAEGKGPRPKWPGPMGSARSPWPNGSVSLALGQKEVGIALLKNF